MPAAENVISSSIRFCHGVEVSGPSDPDFNSVGMARLVTGSLIGLNQ